MEKNLEELIFCQVLDQDLHLTLERRRHIYSRHPELKSLEKEFQNTILLPEVILKKITGEYLLVKWHSFVFGGKFIVIVFKKDKLRSWIITAYLSRKMPAGEFCEN
jgi:hypothetical protein